MASSTPSRILITGCTGFVGKYVAEQCRLRYPQADLFGLAGHTVPSTIPSGQSTVKLLVADITQRDQIGKWLPKYNPI